MRASGTKIIATHRKATFQYEILEKYEAGLMLVGSEVKALREGRANLADAYAHFSKGECWLASCHIGTYAQAGPFNHAPTRLRKLLLHRSEIEKLASKTKEKGLTLVPLSLYFKDGRAKVELGLARGKKMHDKRESIKRREIDREIAVNLKRKNR